jgi:hypothetical protein
MKTARSMECVPCGFPSTLRCVSRRHVASTRLHNRITTGKRLLFASPGVTVHVRYDTLATSYTSSNL